MGLGHACVHACACVCEHVACLLNGGASWGCASGICPQILSSLVFETRTVVGLRFTDLARLAGQ